MGDRPGRRADIIVSTVLIVFGLIALTVALMHQAPAVVVLRPIARSPGPQRSIE